MLGTQRNAPGDVVEARDHYEVNEGQGDDDDRGTAQVF